MKDDGGTTTAEEVFESIESKNNMIKQAQCVEMYHNIQERKRTMKNEKCQVLNNLSQRYGNKIMAEVNMKLYKETLDVWNNTDNDDNDSINGINESR